MIKPKICHAQAYRSKDNYVRCRTPYLKMSLNILSADTAQFRKNMSKITHQPLSSYLSFVFAFCCYFCFVIYYYFLMTTAAVKYQYISGVA